jgi:4'-phosphopantetheinyl transferase
LWFFPQWSIAGRSGESSIVRSLLGAYVGDEVAIDYDIRGKAQVRGDRLQFNVSHSGGALALAVSRSQPLGIDLEHERRPRRVSELAHRFFAAHEAAALEHLPEMERQTTFLQLWTRKEALVKAEGVGISGALHRAVFDFDDHGEIAGPSDRSWQVLPFVPAAGFYGALAWRGPLRPISYLVCTNSALDH